MSDSSDNAGYPGFSPFIFTPDFCCDEPAKAGVLSSLATIRGYSGLLVEIEKESPNSQQLGGWLTYLEYGCLGLYFVFDGEPQNGKLFSDLHDSPVAVAEPAPSFAEGVARWMQKTGEFFRLIRIAHSDNPVEPPEGADPEFLPYLQQRYPYPGCLADLEFARRVLQDIGPVDVFAVVTGIEMEARKLGIDMPPSEPDGPYGAFQWQHNGEVITDTMKPAAWKMVRHLWDAEGNAATFDDLKVPVYDDVEHEADEVAFGSHRKEANRYFQQHGIPWKVSLKKTVVSLSPKEK